MSLHRAELQAQLNRRHLSSLLKRAIELSIRLFDLFGLSFQENSDV